MDNILTIKDLSKRYGHIQAVDNLTLEIPPSSIFGILGPNGSGKTTTLGMVLGVISPQQGSFQWFGAPLSHATKRRIGAILETPNFYPYMTAVENLKLVAKIKELENPDIEGVLKKVNLHQRANSQFKTFSLGMKQRLAIASALLNDPEVLVLDEPTNGLDPQGIAEIRELIKHIAASGISVILASHLLDEVEKICTHTAILRHGKLLFSGTVDEITGEEGIIELGVDNVNLARQVLEAFSEIKSITEENGNLTLVLKSPLDSSAINKRLTENGLYAHHLVFRKNSLEKQFLNLIQS